MNTNRSQLQIRAATQSRSAARAFRRLLEVAEDKAESGLLDSFECPAADSKKVLCLRKSSNNHFARASFCTAIARHFSSSDFSAVFISFRMKSRPRTKACVGTLVEIDVRTRLVHAPIVRTPMHFAAIERKSFLAMANSEKGAHTFR